MTSASNSRKNQSEDDRESTDDGLDLFTDHQVHLSTSRQWLCLSCMTSAVFCCCFFFLLLIEIISIAKLLIIVHFLSENMRNKHIATFTQNLKVIETHVLGVFFLSNLFCWSTRFSARTLKITWAWEVDAPKITWYEWGEGHSMTIRKQNRLCSFFAYFVFSLMWMKCNLLPEPVC